MTVPAYPGRLAAERRTPINPNPNTTAPALASLDELIALVASTVSAAYRTKARR